MERAYEPTPRTAIKRVRKNGVYDRAAIAAILDEALVCHVGFTDPAGHPAVIPTGFVREGDFIYLHGKSNSHMLQCFTAGEICVTVTLLDGLVVARGAFKHSVNYRSVVAFGRGELVTDPDEELRALRLFTDKVLPGRWAQCRPHTQAELTDTKVVRLPLTEVSAKVREGMPNDLKEDHGLPIWSGVVPLVLQPQPPVPDQHTVKNGTPAPPNVRHYRLGTSLPAAAGPASGGSVGGGALAAAGLAGLLLGVAVGKVLARR